jgi:hypothetical protein
MGFHVQVPECYGRQGKFGRGKLQNPASAGCRTRQGHELFSAEICVLCLCDASHRRQLTQTRFHVTLLPLIQVRTEHENVACSTFEILQAFLVVPITNLNCYTCNFILTSDLNSSFVTFLYRSNLNSTFGEILHLFINFIDCILLCIKILDY